MKLPFSKRNKPSRPSSLYVRDNAFMISCAARSGSTHLAGLIRSHPDLFCHGEALAGNKVNDLWGTYEDKFQKKPILRDKLSSERAENPENFIYKYVLDTQGYKGIGFKYKTDESLSEAYKHITEIIIKDTDIKIIFLIRRNLLAQYVSHQVVLHQTGQTYVIHDENIPKINKFSINPQECISYFRDVIHRQRKAEKLFSKHRTFKITYEEITDNACNKAIALSNLQEFLGVQNIELSSPTKKIIREPLDNLLINYSEVCQELKLNKMEKYFLP